LLFLTPQWASGIATIRLFNLPTAIRSHHTVKNNHRPGRGGRVTNREGEGKMINIPIREVVHRFVEAPEKYPFYRKEGRVAGNVNYWKFESANHAVVLIFDGARTTIIDYNTNADNTPLTPELLDASSDSVFKIERDEFEHVLNAHIVKMVKLVH